jgi:hypothetical protein
MGTHPFMMLVDVAMGVASGLSIVFLCKTLLNILNKQSCESTSISRKIKSKHELSKENSWTFLWIIVPSMDKLGPPSIN